MFIVSMQGGFITTSEISAVLGKEEMVIYKCLAANDALGQTVEDSLTLRVLCKISFIVALTFCHLVCF